MLRSKSLIIALLGLVVFSLSLAEAEEKEEAEIELIPVYEKTFDDTIVDVVFDTVTVSIEEAKQMGWKEEAFTKEEKVKGKATVVYPKMVMVGPGLLSWYHPDNIAQVKEIKLYDSKGKMQKRILLERKVQTSGDLKGGGAKESIVISPKGRYFLLARYPTEAIPDWMGGTLYRINGEKVWEKYPAPSPIAVSDEGYVVAATYVDWQAPPEPGTDFIFYDLNGREIKTIKNPNPKIMVAWFAKFSEDGEYVILAFKRETAPPTTFVLAKKDGTILWHKDFPEYRFSARGEEIDIIPEIGITGIFRDGGVYTFFIDWQGNLKWNFRLETKGNMNVKISEDKKKVYIVSVNGYLGCINIDDGEIPWEHKGPWFQPKVPFFTELRIIRDTIYLIDKEDENWHSSKLFVFDGQRGDLLKKIDYPQEQIIFAKISKDRTLINATKRLISILKEEVLK